MPPKKNAKKGKKGGDDDDEYWAAKEAALASPAAEPEEADEDEGGGGGLMARLRKTKKKRNTFADLDQEDDSESKPAGIEDVRANPDDEWPEDDVKPKKGKKGKKAKKQQVDSDEEEDTKAEEVPEVKAAPVKVEKPVEKEIEEEKDDEDDEGPKLLTKKEKEKLKKEKEKEKKKAQAAAKRAAAGDSAPATPSAPAPPTADTAPAPPADEAEEDDVDADDATAADKKKKKKKKAAPKVEAPPAPAKGKKVPAHIAAMQAAVAEKKRLEEEAAAAEAERQRILAEEDARIEEEEAKVEAQKAAKKAKEKERLERLKKEGKLLSPAEKQRRAVAEARKQAMLDAGVKVAGLQEGGAVIKKPFNKKKPAPKPKAPTPAPVASTSAAPEAEASPEEASVDKLADDVKDLKVDEESEDDWDKSSEDEAPAKAPATPAAEAKAAPPTQQAATAAPTNTAAPSTSAPAANGTSNVRAPAAASSSKPAANGKPAAQASGQPNGGDDSSDDDDDDDDEDDSSDEDTESDSSVDSEDERIEAGRAKYAARRDAAVKASEGKTELRSPICCILGHVDHGKTRLLDKIRQTNVADGEAGGITQQIGATFFPSDAIISKSNIVNVDNYEIEIPGLLIIDTPGHEAFGNLRSRGSSLCNIAILVVDITQAFEKQTWESLKLLKEGKTPFVVAVNKIDRLLEWQSTPDNGFRASYEQQGKATKRDFENRLSQIKLSLSEAGFNSDIFDQNKKLGSVVSLVPTSAFTGEGIPDMLLLLAKLTQERMNKSLMYVSSLSCTILEVKKVEEMGTTLDVILSNGHLNYGDTIVLCGTDGPIVTKVRALLTPQPMRELRIKSSYVRHDTVKAALGVKIFAPGLDKAIAGARVYVAENEDEEAYFKDLCMDDLQTLKRFAVGQKGKGVYVQASTLGALEALLTFLQTSKIPVHDFGVGPVFAKTIRQHASMAEKAPEYACVLAFDVPIEKDAKDFAAKEGLKIFAEPVIYHLFDSFNKYLAEVIEARERDAKDLAVWPVRLSIIASFANRDPIILGCDIKEGTLRVGTPVGVVKYDKATKVREIIKLGKITSLEKEHKSVDIVKKTAVGGGVAVKIERAPWEAAKLFGRHFDLTDEVVSLISRKSIDTLKDVFRKQVSNDEWNMIRKMKDEQGIQ